MKATSDSYITKPQGRAESLWDLQGAGMLAEVYGMENSCSYFVSGSCVISEKLLCSVSCIFIPFASLPPVSSKHPEEGTHTGR